MSESIFRVVQLRKKSFLQQLLKQEVDENAVIQLNNLLANKQILDIENAEIAAIETKYNVILNKHFLLNLQEFYAVYLGYCLRKKDVSVEDQKVLSRLLELFKITFESVAFLHTKLGEGIFQDRFKQVISNGRLSNQDEEALTDFANRLKLPQNISDSISANVRRDYVKNFVAKVVDDQRFSPSEQRELIEVQRSLKVDLSFDRDLNWKLEKLKTYWNLENNPLPEIVTEIVLQKSEICHFQTYNVNWYELRTVTTRVAYSGYSTRIKIAKGFYLRTGSYTPRTYTTEQMKLIDSGTLYLTNKRIIFSGRLKSSNIRLEKIIDYEPYSDGVEIRKDAGKNPVLKIGSEADVFCIILGRLLGK